MSKYPTRRDRLSAWEDAQALESCLYGMLRDDERDGLSPEEAERRSSEIPALAQEIAKVQQASDAKSPKKPRVSKKKPEKPKQRKSRPN